MKPDHGDSTLQHYQLSIPIANAPELTTRDESEEAFFVGTVDWLSRALGNLTSAMLLAMLLMICYDVMMRYVFNEPTSWATELSTYLLVAVSFAGLSYALMQSGHIRVELLIGSMPKARRIRFELITGWIGVLFVLVATWQAAIMVYDNYVNQIRSFSLLTTPVYLPQIPIAIGLFVFGSALLAEIYRLSLPLRLWRQYAVLIIVVALFAALLYMGVHPPRVFASGFNWGFILIFLTVLAGALFWSGWRVFCEVTVMLAVAGGVLYAARALPTLPAAIILVMLVSVLLAMGMRISLALGTAGMLAIAFLLPSAPLITIADRSWDSLDSFTLTAIPMFVLMGALLMKSGLTEMMLDTLMKWVGGISGGVAYAGITACAIFAAVCGSSVATAATIGMVACPEMIKRGYSPRLAYGTIAAGGTLGILIPPSIVMIIYGSTVGVPIATLFIAGIIPGLLLTLLFMVVVFGWILVSPGVAPALERKVSWADKISSLLQILPILLLIIAVLGMLYAGVATPTEAAAIATLASLIICWWRGRLSLKILRDTLSETVVVTSFLLFIVVGASILAFTFDYQRLPSLLVESVKAANLSPGAVLAVIAVPAVDLGMFLDPIAMIVMTLPVLFPLIVALGFDPIWFGVVMVLLVEMCLVCPPLGMNLIVLKSVTGARNLMEIAYGAFPFMIMMALFIYILYLFPALVTWLPKTMASS